MRRSAPASPPVVRPASGSAAGTVAAVPRGSAWRPVPVEGCNHGNLERRCKQTLGMCLVTHVIYTVCDTLIHTHAADVTVMYMDTADITNVI